MLFGKWPETTIRMYAKKNEGYDLGREEKGGGLIVVKMAPAKVVSLGREKVKEGDDGVGPQIKKSMEEGKKRGGVGNLARKLGRMWWVSKKWDLEKGY